MTGFLKHLGGAGRSGGWSVGAKTALLTVVVGCLSFAIVLVVSAWTRSSDSYAAEMQANRSLTQLLTQQVAGAIKWAKSDVIEAAYADLAHGEGSQVSTILVVDAVGKTLSSYAAKELPPFDLAAVLPDLLARLREAKGETVLQRAAHHHVLVVPAHAGKDREYVGAVAVAWSEQRLAAEVGKAIKLEIASALAGLVVLIVVMILALRWTVTGALRRMTQAMAQLAAKDLSVVIPGSDRRDEIGAMAQAVEVFKQAMVEGERLRVDQEAAESRAAAERQAAMVRVAGEFETAVGAVIQGLSHEAEELQGSAKSMLDVAERAGNQAAAVAAASQQASVNVQTVASAGEELSSSIAEIGRQVGESTKIAGQAVKEAQATNAKVESLAEAAQRIGDVVKLINDIAGQTNLLALNATIEAARAGEAGKGFAVVAQEVKSLANQTAKATGEIAAQVGAIQGATQDSVEAIQSIGRTIGQVNEIATAIAAAVEEQGAATREIARNVQEAARGTQEVSSNIGGVTDTAAATGTAATQVLDAAGELARQAGALRTQVDGFLAKVRAA